MQGEMFDDVPDAPREPDFGTSFRSALGQVAAGARAAIAARQQADEAEVAEAARLAELDAADANRDLEAEAREPEPLPSAEVIPLRRAREPKNDGRGDFFAIDHRLWGTVCALGLNAAVAYLVMARGSGGDNRTTSWSVNAVEHYGGIGRVRAKQAIDALRNAGLVTLLKGGTLPRYFLTEYETVTTQRPVAGELTIRHLNVLKRIEELTREGDPAYVPKNGRSRSSAPDWPVPDPLTYARSLANSNYLEEAGDQSYRLTEKGERSVVPRWVWLPNSLIDGAADERRPIERIRQSNFLPALRLLVDLYQAQEIAEVAGADWRGGGRDAYERLKVGKRGLYVIWAFRYKYPTAWDNGPLAAPHRDETKEAGARLETFWKALRIVKASGLVESIPHLVESEKNFAEVIHPMPIGLGHEQEQAITAAAERAARAMVSTAQIEQAEASGFKFFVPVEETTEDVAMIGIYRLRYRARTNAARIWLANESDWAELAARYDAMAAAMEAEQHATSR